jgi:hypothetical protein
MSASQQFRSEMFIAAMPIGLQVRWNNDLQYGMLET